MFLVTSVTVHCLAPFTLWLSFNFSQYVALISLIIYICTIACRKRVEALDTSFHEHMAPDQEEHMCTECGKQLKSKSGLRLHVKRHSGTGSHCCAKCNVNFVEKSEIVAGMYVAHAVTNTRHTLWPLP